MIRKHNLLGAGFYWLMYSLMSAFSILYVIASSKLEIVSKSFLVLTSFLLLFYSIKNRSKVKEKITLTLEWITAMNIAACALCLYLVVDESSQVTNIFFETFRALSGALVLGGVTTAMLLGHWYLVQPGLSRRPIEELTNYAIVFVVFNIIFWLIPPSMLDVFTGEVSDGWGGTLGYMWIGAAITSIVLLIASRQALKETSYTAVMATTGLLYLAVLMSSGVELIPRTIFA